jgi:hypothetical protein
MYFMVFYENVIGYSLNFQFLSGNPIFKNKSLTKSIFSVRDFCIISSIPNYPILNTVTLSGGNTNAAEKSLPFHGSASIFIGLELVTPLPP